MEKLKKDQTIEENELDFKIAGIKEKINMDKMHDETTLKKYKIDATSRIYESMNIKDVKVNKFGDRSLMDLLPTVEIGK